MRDRNEPELDKIAALISKVLESLGDEDRIDILHNLNICLHCGAKITAQPCYCTRDD
jgi:hypothetical protein